jgi:uncharacterized membrane protein
LTPFATAWMGDNHFSSLPVALYGTVLLCSAIAYYVLCQVLISHHGRDSLLATAVGNDMKGKASTVVYAVAIPLSFYWPMASCALYALVVALWLIPDRRIERVIGN